MSHKVIPIKKICIAHRVAIVGFILIFAMSASSAQQELKLLCNLRLTKTFASGNQEQLSVRSILQVNDFGGQLSIIPDGDELASISTYSRPDKNTDNFSNGNKWDIHSVTLLEGKRTVIRMVIDRNTGRITYRHDWRDSTIVTAGDGVCEKVDLSVRKF